MKCLNNTGRRAFGLFCLAVLFVSMLSGCSIGTPYDTNEPLHVGSTDKLPIVRPAGLAAENVVIPYDAYVYDDDGMEYEAGLLINETQNRVIQAVNLSCQHDQDFNSDCDYGGCGTGTDFPE